MKVYYGIDRQAFVSAIPYAMVSIRSYINRSFVPDIEWFLDSGAFTFLLKDGKFPFTTDEYVSMVRASKPDIWANMDWCCEENVLKSTGLTVKDHIQKTVENGRALIDRAPGFVMILQGYEESDYLECIDMSRDAGLLTPIMGIGTLCRRNATMDILSIAERIRREIPDHIKLHGFGVKTDILKIPRIYQLLHSVDTYAWAYNAQKEYVKGEGYNAFGRRKLTQYRKNLEMIIEIVRGQPTVHDFLDIDISDSFTPIPELDGFCPHCGDFNLEYDPDLGWWCRSCLSREAAEEDRAMRFDDETTVVHCKKDNYDVMIDRTTKWGNPFRIGPDGDREEVIHKYREWIIERSDLLDDLSSLIGKRLGCWCSPEPCHGNVLIELIKERYEDE